MHISLRIECVGHAPLEARSTRAAAPDMICYTHVCPCAGTKARRRDGDVRQGNVRRVGRFRSVRVSVALVVQNGSPLR